MLPSAGGAWTALIVAESLLTLLQEGSCIRGESCPYAHNVFEYWLHPTRQVLL